MASIFYLSRVNLLSSRTHVHNISKTCESLTKIKNIEMTLVSSSFSLNKEEIQGFLKEHSIKQEFPIVILDSLSNYFKDSRFRLFNWLGVILDNFILIKFLFCRRKQIDIIYFRDQHIFLAIIFGKYFLGKPVFFEVHAAKRKKHTQILLNLMARISNGVIAISWALKKYYERFNQNIIVAFCLAVEIENFPYDKNRKELRKELDLPLDKIIVGYAGRLDLVGSHGNYEIDKVVKALKFLPQNILFLIIGVKEKEAKLLEKIAENIGVGSRIKVYPRLSRLKIPAYLLSFDILVIPKLGDLPGDSPAKMFEYLATKRPIIAAKTEPVSEVLQHGSNSLLVFSNTSNEWAKTIQRVIDNKELSDRISQNGFEDSKKYTWERRAEKISEFVRTVEK